MVFLDPLLRRDKIRVLGVCRVSHLPSSSSRRGPRGRRVGAERLDEAADIRVALARRHVVVAGAADPEGLGRPPQLSVQELPSR